MSRYMAYYDASGTQSEADNSIVIAGLVASIPKWECFDVAWSATLAEFGVPYLHMREYAHSLGPFESWKENKTKRVAFLSRLVDSLSGSVERAFLFRVVPSDFNHVNKQYRLATTLCPNPYTFAAWRCLMRVQNWHGVTHPRSPIQHMIEPGDSGQGPLADFVRKGKMNVAVVPKTDPVTNEGITPFQAADLVAYEVAAAIKKRRSGDPRPSRESLRALRRLIPLEPTTITRQGMTEMCRAHPDKFPLRDSKTSG